MGIAGDPWINPITLRGSVAQEYWNAIEHSRSTLPDFVASFQKRSKAQSRFLVCGLVERGRHFLPVGVLVDRINGDKFLGTILENDAKGVQSEQPGEIESKYVIDWSFVDLWELQGGKLWREVYRKLDEGHRVGATQFIFRICQLEPPQKQTLIQRMLLRSIVESDYKKFEKLFKEASSPEAISMTKYDSERHWTSHGMGHTCELVLQFSSIEFIEQAFRELFEKSDDYIFIASCVKRPEVFDFVRQLGVSAEVKTLRLVTPLHLASRSGDHYALGRLLEMQADINAQDNRGRTPLHEAANAKIFAMLLDAGGDPRIKTKSRFEPQDAIEMHMAEGHIDILEECGTRGLIEPATIKNIRDNATIHEKGSDAIQEHEESIGSDTYAVSISFRAGPVLPFDYIDAKSGQVAFNSVTR